MAVRKKQWAGSTFLRGAMLVAGVGALVSGAVLTVGCDKDVSATTSVPRPAMKVTVVKAEPSDVALTGEWVGTLDGYVNAQIQPQASGYLIRQDYREGSQVEEGQVLFEIDPRPFEAALEQAQGQLGQAQAQLALAQINVNRDTPLAEAHAIARSQLDNEIQQKAQAEAAVKTAEAAVATANLNLGFTKVRSLITGVAGQATTQVGNLVSTQSVLTSVSQLESNQGLFFNQRQRISCVDEAGCNRWQRLTSRSVEDSADTYSVEWGSLSAKRSRGFCRPAVELANRCDSHRCFLPKSGKHSSSRTIRQSKGGDRSSPQCDSGSAGGGQ